MVSSLYSFSLYFFLSVLLLFFFVAVALSDFVLKRLTLALAKVLRFNGVVAKF